MANLRFKPVIALAVALAATLVAGCTSTGTTGDGNTVKGSRGGGWENFRADAPPALPTDRLS
jgi:hypothetical protein